ncbi:ABC transporter permease [Chitinophaga rhizosphaerae]|uniref:ABC transporter permease n=1 Tax=Chitinophaga rhizosphaerae TaxID=1864947 RepID=UPI000F8140B6|nr:ABC transporter permease [Chitinophaga rhizosphaerae]
MIRRIQIACRTLSNRPLYALLNIGGLAIGLAVSALLFLWVQDEHGNDGFHQHADHIYKVNTWFESGGKKEYWDEAAAGDGFQAMLLLPSMLLPLLLVLLAGLFLLNRYRRHLSGGPQTPMNL